MAEELKAVFRRPIIPTEALDTIEKIKLAPCQFETERERRADRKRVGILYVHCGTCPRAADLTDPVCAAKVAEEIRRDPSIETVVFEKENLRRLVDPEKVMRFKQLVTVWSSLKIPLTPDPARTKVCELHGQTMKYLYEALKAHVLSDPVWMLAYAKERMKELQEVGKAVPACMKCRSEELNFFKSLIESLGRTPVGKEILQEIKEMSLEDVTAIAPYMTSRLIGGIITEMGEETVERFRPVELRRIIEGPFAIGSWRVTIGTVGFRVANMDFEKRERVYYVESGIEPMIATVIDMVASLLRSDPRILAQARYIPRTDALKEIAKPTAKQYVDKVIEANFPNKAEEFTAEVRDFIVERALEYVFGWGIWEVFVKDDDIYEFQVREGRPVEIIHYRYGKLTSNVYPTEWDFERFIRLIKVNLPGAEFYNYRLDVTIDPEKHPLKDAKMRLSIFKPPHTEGYYLIVRKHRGEELSVSELMYHGTAPPLVWAYLTLVRRRPKSDILWVGAVGSGKTTDQVAIDSKLPSDFWVMQVGDTHEFDLAEYGYHTLTLKTDPPDRKVIGIGLHEALMSMLRMREDITIVPEVRDAEGTNSRIHYLVSGKAGSSTYHASSIEKALIRMADELQATGTVNPSIKLTGLQLIVEASRLDSVSGYVFRITDVVEVQDEVDEKTKLPRIKRLFEYDPELDETTLAWEGISRKDVDKYLREIGRADLTALDDLKLAKAVRDLRLPIRYRRGVWQRQISREELITDKLVRVNRNIRDIPDDQLLNELAFYEAIYKRLKERTLDLAERGLLHLVPEGKIQLFRFENELFKMIFDAEMDLIRRMREFNLSSRGVPTLREEDWRNVWETLEKEFIDYIDRTFGEWIKKYAPLARVRV